MPTPGEIAADRCPTDVQEYGQRNGLPEFARATWQAGFIDGYRFAAQRGAEVETQIARDSFERGVEVGELLPREGAPPQTGGGDRYRHKKRGTTYRVIGVASSQVVGEPIGEGSLAVVYRSEDDGSLWVRPYDEFHDGRFQRAEGPQTGGGDAGERPTLADFKAAREIVNDLVERCGANLDDELQAVLVGDIADTRCSSHREGWIAGRDASARAVMAPVYRGGHDPVVAIRALPIPGKTDAG